MKLSEAIERGIPSVPGGAHSYFRFVGATARDYSQRVAHHKPLESADALGTAIVGMAGDAVRAAEECYEGPYGGPHMLLTRLYPELQERVACPVCHNASAIDLSPMTMVKMIWHVQDTHGWKREQVAAWLKGTGH
jgi:hypothetical protein